jgi:hypothetical protein
MDANTRRAMLAMLLGAGAVSVFSARPGPLSAAPALPLRLPETPLGLARVLQRGQGEAAAITVRRRWEVRFTRQARGIVVTGQQTAAEVSAPPHLAELARIEQQRDASAMFPVMLAEDGAIMATGSAPASADTIGAALRAAEAMIARQPVPAEERERYRLYLAQVHRAGAGVLDTLPADLFFPTSAPIARNEVLSLPDGLTGSFALRYAGEPHADAPWLKRAERHVVTRIGGLERMASEVWTLGPA